MSEPGATLQRGVASRFFDPPKPRLIAHRGASGSRPENTLAAFRRAAEEGAEMIELDLHLSADGVPVVLHDARLERTTDGAGPLRRRTAAALAALDAGFRWSDDGGRSRPFRGGGQGVPSLSEVLGALPDIRFTLEVKTPSARLDESLRDALRAVGAEARVLLACHSGPVIRRLRGSFEGVPTNVARDEVAAFLRHGAQALPVGARAFQVPPRHGLRQLVTRDFVEAAHAADREVHVWTVNEPAAMRALLGLGVDGIMTDFPARLLGVYRDRGLR
ncbi:MAG: glycerophosphodiester phosphodiesterase [Gemmatimonadota bacterium]